MAGEQGLPCGNALLWHAICARIVATAGCSEKFLSFIKNPRTRPKLIVPKKSCKSTLNTYLRFKCFEALEIIERFFLKPCASWSSHFCVTLSSCAQFCSKFESRC